MATRKSTTNKASPGGKTPEATLCASILRDTRKGQDAQFRKVDRGLFILASQKYTARGLVCPFVAEFIPLLRNGLKSVLRQTCLRAV